MADQLGADAPARDATSSAPDGSAELDDTDPMDDIAQNDGEGSGSAATPAAGTVKKVAGGRAKKAAGGPAKKAAGGRAKKAAAPPADTAPAPASTNGSTSSSDSDSDEALATDLFSPRPDDTAAVVTGASVDHRGDAAEPDTAAELAPGAVGARSESPSSGVLERLGVRPRGRLRARKVQRIVRRVDPWSVLKVSLIFYFCVWLMVMVAAVLIWGAAVGSGTVSSLESFIAEFLAFEEFSFNGDQLFQIFALGGLIGVFVATAATAVLAVLFNLIADLTGGIRFTVIEEESARRLINPR